MSFLGLKERLFSWIFIHLPQITHFLQIGRGSSNINRKYENVKGYIFSFLALLIAMMVYLSFRCYISHIFLSLLEMVYKSQYLAIFPVLLIVIVDFVTVIFSKKKCVVIVIIDFVLFSSSGRCVVSGTRSTWGCSAPLDSPLSTGFSLSHGRTWFVLLESWPP